jgi:hypothetical protein
VVEAWASAHVVGAAVEAWASAHVVGAAVVASATHIEKTEFCPSLFEMLCYWNLAAVLRPVARKETR